MQMELWGRGEFEAQPVAEPMQRPSALHLRIKTAIALGFLDLLALGLTFLLGLVWFDNQIAVERTFDYLFIAACTYFICAIYGRAYNHEVIERISKGLNRSFAAIVTAISTIFVLTLFSENLDLKLVRTMSIFAILAILLLVFGRLIFDKLISCRIKSVLFDRVYILDGIKADVPGGFRTIDASKQAIEPDANDPMMRHWAALFLQDADRVVVACRPERYLQWAKFLKGSNVRVEIIMPELDELGIVSIARQNGNTTIGVSKGQLSRKNRILKRAFDFVLASLLLIPAIPIILVCGLLIKLEDRGPVFFRQQRMGRGNRLFELLKLRSMPIPAGTDAGAGPSRPEPQEITRIGRFIRGTSIDELPQLFNVVCGQMSLVGPRPHALESCADNKPFWEVDEKYWKRHAIKPGITGLAQVRGYRGATNQPDDLTNRLNCDLEYLQGWSIWRDLKILFATFRVMVHKNAY